MVDKPEGNYTMFQSLRQSKPLLNVSESVREKLGLEN